MLSELEMQPEWVPAFVRRQPAYTTRPSAGRHLRTASQRNRDA
jgi:hypothetical protein